MRMRKTTTEQQESLSEDELYRQAVNKALFILEHSDKSEAELRRRLVMNSYPEAIVDRAMEYVRDLHYIDDERYASSYIRTHSGALSRREMSNKLLQKGISREVIDAAFQTAGEEDPSVNHAETAAAVRTLSTKLGTRRKLTPKERMSVYGHMLRKGFKRDDIIAAFEELEVVVDREEIPFE